MEFYIFFASALLIPICFPYVKTPRDLSIETKSQLSLFFSILMILFVAGFRGLNVGADSKQYASAYDQLKSLSISDALTVPIRSWSGYYTYSLEKGYRLYNKIVGLFGGSSQAIIFCNSLIIAILLYRLIRRNSPYFGLSIWLYVTLGFFQTEMNMTRNAIAILLCLNATAYIKARKLVKYALLIMLASTFHSTALVFIPLYWIINYIELTPKRLKILAILSIATGLIGTQVYYLLLKFAPSRYALYLVLAKSETEGPILVFLFLGIFFFIWFFCGKKLDANTFVMIDNTGAWMLILMILSFSLSMTISVFTRVAALFSPYLIIYYPEMISCGISNKRNRRIIIVALVLALFIVYAFRLSVNNIGQTIPYSFCWET